MKSISILLIVGCLSLTINTNAQLKKRGEFILKGTVNYPVNRYIYFIWYNADEKRFCDSSYVKDNRFSYKGVSNGFIDRFYIKTNPSIKSNSDYVNNVAVPIDNSIMTIKLKIDSFSKYQLDGCKTCDLIKRKNKYYSLKYEKKLERYYGLINNSAYVKEKKQNQIKYTEIDEQWDNEILNWCLKNPDNNFSPLGIIGYVNKINDPEIAEALYQQLSSFQKKSYYGELLKKEIEKKIFIKKLTGQKASVFNKIGVDKDTVNLESINKNNYVLLDFWATWCAPCRAAHPLLIKLYDKYCLNNFKIIGIAQNDNDIDNWKKIINIDSLTNWYNILDGIDGSKENERALSTIFYVKVLPTKILIDPKGNIVGRYDNMEELEKELKKIFGF